MPPPPPPPPPPPAAGPPKAAPSGGAPAFLADIQKGARLKKVPESEKKDRSEVRAVTSGGSSGGGGGSSGGPPLTGVAARNPGLSDLFKEMGTKNLKPANGPKVPAAPAPASQPAPPPPSMEQRCPRFRFNPPAPINVPSAAPVAPPPMVRQNSRPQAPPPPIGGNRGYSAAPPPPPSVPNQHYQAPAHPRPPPAPPSIPSQTEDLEARFGKLFLPDNHLPAPPRPYTGPKTFISQLAKKPRAPQVPAN